MSEAETSINPLHDAAATAPPGSRLPVGAELAVVSAGRPGERGRRRSTHVGVDWSPVEMTRGRIQLNRRGLPRGGALVSLADAPAGSELSAGRLSSPPITRNPPGRDGATRRQPRRTGDEVVG